MTDRPAFGLDPNTIVQRSPSRLGSCASTRSSTQTSSLSIPTPRSGPRAGAVRTDDGQARLVPITAGEFHEDIDLGSGWVRLRMKLR